MRVAILSDVHDQTARLAATLDCVRAASTDTLLCCGDLCTPAIVAQLAAGFSGPIHLVLGNNDRDPDAIAAEASRHAKVTYHGELADLTLAGRRIGVTHYPKIGRRLAATGAFDLVCYGHSHRYEVIQSGRTLQVNPGEIQGRRGAITLALYETDSTTVTRVEVPKPPPPPRSRGSKVRRTI